MAVYKNTRALAKQKRSTANYNKPTHQVMDCVLILSKRPPVQQPATPGQINRPPGSPNPMLEPVNPPSTPAIPVGSPVNTVTVPGTQGIQLVSSLPDDRKAALLDNLFPSSLDVDKWEIAMSPDFYQQAFNNPLALVQLASHVPKRTPCIASTSLIDDWMLLANATHQIWVEAKIKHNFFRRLQDWQTVQPGKFRLQATLGRVLVPVSVFVDCLNKAQCTTMVIKAYGQKLALLDRFINTEPAQVDHHLAQYNQWDIGQSFKSHFIWLWSPSDKFTGTSHPIQ